MTQWYIFNTIIKKKYIPVNQGVKYYLVNGKANFCFWQEGAPEVLTVLFFFFTWGGGVILGWYKWSK